MKGIICLAMAQLMLFHGNGQTKEFEIIGKILNLDKDTTVYFILNTTRDTVSKEVTQNGVFRIKGVIAFDLEWSSIRVPGMKVWPTFLVENNKIEIVGTVENWANATVSGSVETSYFQKYLAIVKPLKDRLNDLRATIDPSISDVSVLSIQDSILLVRRKFILDNNNSAYCAWLAQNTSKFGVDTKQLLYEKMTDRVKNTNFGKSLRRHIDLLKMRESMVNKKISPDFVTETTDEKLVSLKDLIKNNSLTLVDFWASWCKPCRAMTEELKEIHKDFNHKGFSIISISLDKSEAQWRVALSQDQTPWANTRVVENVTDPLSIYDIQAIPALILLDKSGKILAIECPMSSIESFGFKKDANNTNSIDIYATVSEVLKSIRN